jgi:hypothetical protein
MIECIIAETSPQALCGGRRIVARTSHDLISSVVAKLPRQPFNE